MTNFLSSQGFFHQDTRDTLNKTLINVGMDGDCKFKSIAAIFLDHYETHRGLDEGLINKILESYAQYYILQPPITLQLTARQRLQDLINSMSTDELIHTLSYTFRQQAVTTILKNPLMYREAFVDKYAEMTIKQMRKTNTWLDKIIISALADNLGISIEVREVNRDTDIPLCLYYNQSAEHPISNPRMIMQCKHGYYQPLLTCSQRYSVDIAVKNPRIDTQINYPADHFDAEIKLQKNIATTIAKNEEKLLQNFTKTSQHLLGLLNDGKLNEQNLLISYIKAINLKKVHGYQVFFDKIIDRAKRQKQTNANPLIIESLSYTQLDPLLAELIHALSRIVSITQINLDEVLCLESNFTCNS